MEPIRVSHCREQQVCVLKVTCGTAAILLAQSNLPEKSSKHAQAIQGPVWSSDPRNLIDRVSKLGALYCTIVARDGGVSEAEPPSSMLHR